MNMTEFFRGDPVQRESVLARYSDLVLVAGVIAIVALMILPLPSLMIDFLVAVSVSCGLGMLLIGIYISTPLEFSVFPSVLLMTTLFRLALSIATTRMILLEGEAGHIIDTFGSVVAGGNLVVGLVVFLIITVVQFIVIAKGAERVAEVAARFSLDAMPGKQLSIDSDLRSALIDKDEAKAKRRSLELESKLHGSLDGAMKFVKGDSIASIVILVINLLGGLAIGVMQLDMDVGAALTKYAILTIGDGMVAQIPALLGAMAAGLIVTRTTDGEVDKHLGDSIRKQIVSKPRVLVVAGSILIMMAAVPGFPAVVFITLGLIATLAGILLTPSCRDWLARRKNPALRSMVQRLNPPAPVKSVALAEHRAAVSLLLKVPAHRLNANTMDALSHSLTELLEEFQLDLGVSLPRIHIHGHQLAQDETWSLLAYEVPIAGGDLPQTSTLTDLKPLLANALRREAAQFLGVQDTTTLLTRAAADLPDVIKEVMRSLPVPRIAEVLRALVGESVSIRNLRDILEALADASQREKDIATLTEFARVALRRETSYRLAPDGSLAALLLEPALEEHLRQSLQTSNGTTQLALPPAQAKALVDQFVSAISQQQEARLAVVTAIDIRAHVRKLIEAECFDTPVLSFHELMPHLQLDVRQHIAPIGAPSLEAA